MATGDSLLKWNVPWIFCIDHFHGTRDVVHVSLNRRYIQWCLGLQVTWSASVLQDEHKFLINFNLMNEQCLAIRVLYYLYTLSAERYVITSRSGLWVIISHARSQSAYQRCDHVCVH
jgi:hypothetical protein